ncbi:MAG TPA: 6-phosphogluconolactonase [Actinomycetes bacterium]|nr:6-phosphogluconolactonase [Actinomycetes bacterium]
MTTPEVFVVRDRELLLEAVAARLVTVLVDRVAASGTARLLLADDTLVTDVLTLVSQQRVRDAVDWSRIEVWWANATWQSPVGASRSVTAAARSLLDLGVPDDRIHPMVSDTTSSSATERTSADQNPEDSAQRYAQALSAARSPSEHGQVPAFTLALLTVGADGGVAGLHPERPSAYANESVTVDRTTSQLSLSAQALSTADQVWLLGEGDEVAAGVHLAASGAGPLQVPAAGVRGTARTLMLVDESAAARLPHALRRIASP